MKSEFGDDELDSETEDDIQLYPDSKFIDDDSYVNEFSWLAVETATLGIIGLTQSILDGLIDNGYALIRPPGHHASIKASGGFCLFNNIAIAAEMVLRTSTKKRVVIIDYDVHHGNGTQDIFYQRNDVLFISIHRYDPGSFYPSTGASSEIGEGKGRGYTINIPISTETTDSDFLEYFQQIIFPITIEYDPDFLFISAGYDILQGDPVGLMSITGTCLDLITKEFIKLMKSKNVLIALEGGYDPDNVAHAVCKSVNSLIDFTNFSPPIDNIVNTSLFKEETEEKDISLHISSKNSKISRNQKKKDTSKFDAKKNILLRTDIKRCAQHFQNYWNCMYKLIHKK